VHDALNLLVVVAEVADESQFVSQRISSPSSRVRQMVFAMRPRPSKSAVRLLLLLLPVEVELLPSPLLASLRPIISSAAAFSRL